MSAQPETVPLVTDEPVWDVWLSSNWLPAVTVADELGIFATLASQPRTAAALAERLRINARGTVALTRLLAALGFLTLEAGVFSLAEKSRLYLLKSGSYYMVPFIRLGLPPRHHLLIAALRRPDRPLSGAAPRPVATGKGYPSDDWARGQIVDDRARLVARVMHSASAAAALGLARSIDLTGGRRLLDVGGGSGCFALAVATVHANVHCTVLDLATMCDVARSYIAAAGLADRVDTHAADMFDAAWPVDYDIILLSNVLHDWDADVCLGLLQRAHAALPPSGRLLVHEMLLDDEGSGSLAAAAFSLSIFLTTQGQQFSKGELIALMEAAGFVGCETTKTFGHYSTTIGRRR